jgi:hypothetical protein
VGRDENGKFKHDQRHDSTPYRPSLPGDERNQIVWSAKLSPSEDRKLTILFDQHRRLFGWQTRSDMLRDILNMGSKSVMADIPNPHPTLIDLQNEQDELAQMTGLADRHIRLSRQVDQTEEALRVCQMSEDGAGMIEILDRWRTVTENVMDRTIREKRRKIFKQRWEGPLKLLMQGRMVSLKPRDQVPDED